MDQIISHSTAVRIGFDLVEYSTSKDAGSVLLQVAVLEGGLDTDVEVRLATRDGSTMCKEQ